MQGSKGNSQYDVTCHGELPRNWVTPGGIPRSGCRCGRGEFWWITTTTGSFLPSFRQGVARLWSWLSKRMWGGSVRYFVKLSWVRCVEGMMERLKGILKDFELKCAKGAECLRTPRFVIL